MVSRVQNICRADLQSLMQNDSELGELFMRTFILRRIELLATSTGDAVVLGSLNSGGTLRLRDFLTRNGYPHTFLDLERDADVQAMLDRFEVTVEDIPVLVYQGKQVLKNPSNEEAALLLGFNLSVDAEQVRDVAIVGAGPAGLSAAVYAASEGLTAILIESKAPVEGKQDQVLKSRITSAFRMGLLGWSSQDAPSIKLRSSAPNS